MKGLLQESQCDTLTFLQQPLHECEIIIFPFVPALCECVVDHDPDNAIALL